MRGLFQWVHKETSRKTHLWNWKIEMNLRNSLFYRRENVFPPLDRISLHVYRQELFALPSVIYQRQGKLKCPRRIKIRSWKGVLWRTSSFTWSTNIFLHHQTEVDQVITVRWLYLFLQMETFRSSTTLTLFNSRMPLLYFNCRDSYLWKCCLAPWNSKLNIPRSLGNF